MLLVKSQVIHMYIHGCVYYHVQKVWFLFNLTRVGYLISLNGPIIGYYFE